MLSLGLRESISHCSLDIMFAEELQGNTSRKRQEEARARRRQLKQQQQKKQQSQEAASVSSSVSSSGLTSAAATPSAFKTEHTTFIGPLTEQPSAKPSAVAAALQQRQIRQEQQMRQKAALIIQSFYIAYRSNGRLVAEQASLLSQRLKDLETLRTLILQKTFKDYVPPPATATVLVRQLLFVTRSIPYPRTNGTSRMHTKLRSPAEDALRLQQVLQYVLMPGILGKDDNLDPLLTWMDGAVGRFRLMELLRLCFVTLTSVPDVSTDLLVTIDSFLRTVLDISTAGSARGAIVEQCRVVLPTICSSYPPPAGKKTKSPPYAVTGLTLDIIQITRYQLLFGSGNPIPNDAEKRRQACISPKLQEQNDVLFQLTLDAIQTAGAGSERRRLQARFVSEILTIPLLTWKVPVASISKLLASTRQSSPLIVVMLESFVQQYATALSDGKIASVLPSFEVPMISCPATTTQCMLANLVQIGRICPSINGSDDLKANYHGAC